MMICTNYDTGIKIQRIRDRSMKTSKFVLYIAIFFNLAIILYFANNLEVFLLVKKIIIGIF